MAAILRIPLADTFTTALGKVTVMLRKTGEFRYSVTLSAGDFSEEKIIGGLRGDDYIELRPLPYGYASDASCILYRLSGSTIVLPNREAGLELRAPLSFGIFHGDTLLVAFSYPRKKLALYGPPDVGDICVYVNERVVSDFLATGLEPALMKVNVINRSSKAVEVTRLLLPIRGSGLYYTEAQGFIYNEFDAVINEIAGKLIAETSTRLAQYPGAIEVHRPRKDSCLMRYGL